MLKIYGWNTNLEKMWNEKKNKSNVKGRVLTQSRELFKVITERGEWICTLPGSFTYDSSKTFPAVGDWVIVEQMPGEERGIIKEVLKRSSLFKRKIAGQEIKEQVIAANIDYAFLVMSCNEDFNVRRLERYLIAAWDSGSKPVVVLTKSDLIDESKRLELECKVEEVAYGVTTFFVSNETKENIDQLQELLRPNYTAALLGSSGVGKSTLVNSLVDEERMNVSEIRQDDGKGRHTTTHRELIVLPEGGIVIDTPGMREFQLWAEQDSQGISQGFSDVEELITQCKFNDCKHDTEPGCAVKQALSEGTLSQERYDSYVKLQKELAYMERKENEKLMRQEKQKWKKISKQLKQTYKKR